VSQAGLTGQLSNLRTPVVAKALVRDLGGIFSARGVVPDEDCLRRGDGSAICL